MSRILLDQAFAVRGLPSRVHRDLLIYFARIADDQGRFKVPAVETLTTAVYINEAGITHAFSDLMELGLVCQLGTTGFWLQLEPEVEV